MTNDLSFLSRDIIEKINYYELINHNNEKAIYKLYIHVVPQNITLYQHDKYYVGITQQDTINRWGHQGHGYYGQPFYNAINKYGWNSIQHYVISNLLTQEQAFELEIETIDYLNSSNRKYGYNIQLGGSGGVDSNEHNVERCGNLEGCIFGDLTVISKANNRKTKSGRLITQWNCRCTCGKEIVCTTESLKRKNKTDCGCKRSEKIKLVAKNKYLNNKYFIMHENFYEYHFGNNVLYFDIEDFDLTSKLYFYKSGNSYRYSIDYNNGKKMNLSSLFYPDKIIHKRNHQANDYRKENLNILDNSKKKKEIIEIRNKGFSYTIPVLQFDKKNNLIAEFSSINVASIKSNVNKCNISACCKGRQKTAGGYVWKYKNKSYETHTITKPIYKCDLNANLLAEYSDIHIASNESNISENMLYKALHSEKHYSSGYLWTHDLNTLQPYQKAKNNSCGIAIAVCQFDLNENISNIYDSINDASNLTHVDASSIIRCCKGKQKTAGNYKWKYKTELVNSGSFLLPKKEGVA